MEEREHKVTNITGPSQPKPRFDTYAKMRWDEEYLYIGAYIQDPQVCSSSLLSSSLLSLFYHSLFDLHPIIISIISKQHVIYILVGSVITH